MPWSALPDHLNTPEKVESAFPDDSQYGDSWFGRAWKRFHKITKPWTAFGPRCTERWARFREYPKVICAFRGLGKWRFESDLMVPLGWDTLKMGLSYPGWYLSRVQYWCDWHIALQWPLVLHGHFGIWQFYIGFKRDADRVYWLALYFGRKWK